MTGIFLHWNNNCPLNLLYHLKEDISSILTVYNIDVASIFSKDRFKLFYRVENVNILTEINFIPSFLLLILIKKIA